MTKPNKPREFWLYRDTNNEDYLVYNSKSSMAWNYSIHVIEYAAYESALKMLEEMAGALAVYEHDHSRIVDAKMAASTLDKYHKWKENIK